MEAEMRQKARDPVTKEEPLTVLSGESMVCRENDTSQDMKKKKKKGGRWDDGINPPRKRNEFSMIEREFLQV